MIRVRHDRTGEPIEVEDESGGLARTHDPTCRGGWLGEDTAPAVAAFLVLAEALATHGPAACEITSDPDAWWPERYSDPGRTADAPR